MIATANQLLNAARNVASKDAIILDNRWQITSAALARQSVENGVESWMVQNGVQTEDANWKVQFLCLGTLHPDPGLVGELRHVWCRLSDACHATSYELPPTEQELSRWFGVIDRFLASS